MKNYKTREDLLKEYSELSKEDLVAILVAKDLSKIRNYQMLDGMDLSSSIFPDPSKTYIHEYIHNSLLGCYGNSLLKEDKKTFFNCIDADPSRVPMIPYTNTNDE